MRPHDEDALDLATRLHVLTGRQVETGPLRGASRRTQEVRLPETIPVEIRYRTMEVRGDALWVHPDVFGKAQGSLVERAREALARAGARAFPQNEDTLRSAVKGVRSARSVLLDRLRASGSSSTGRPIAPPSGRD